MVCLSVGLSVTIVSPAETVEPIEIPFGLWARVGPWNHVLESAYSAKFRGSRSSPLPRCGDVSIFNIEAVRHLGFSSSEKVLENPR